MVEVVRPPFYALHAKDLLRSASGLDSLWVKGNSFGFPRDTPSYAEILEIPQERLEDISSGEVSPSSDESDKILALYFAFLEIRLNTRPHQVDLFSPEFFDKLRSGELTDLGKWREPRKFPVRLKPEVREGIQDFSDLNELLGLVVYQGHTAQYLQWKFQEGKGWKAEADHHYLYNSFKVWLSPHGLFWREYTHSEPFWFQDLEQAIEATEAYFRTEYAVVQDSRDYEKIRDIFVYKTVRYEANVENPCVGSMYLDNLITRLQSHYKGESPFEVSVSEYHDDILVDTFDLELVPFEVDDD